MKTKNAQLQSSTVTIIVVTIFVILSILAVWKFDLIHKLDILLPDLGPSTPNTEEPIELKSCLETCQMHGGYCLPPGTSSQMINIGPFNCNKGESCYVVSSDSLNNGPKIEKFELNNFNDLPIDMLKNDNSVVFSNNEFVKITFYLIGDADYCYKLKTNDKILEEGNDLGVRKILREPSFTISPETKFLEIIAWDMNDNKKVSLNRIEFNSNIQNEK